MLIGPGFRKDRLIEVAVGRLRPGMFIHLDLGWMNHPFPRSRFKISSTDEIRQIRELGLRTVKYSEWRSDAEPCPEESAGADVEPEQVEPSPEVAAALARKRQHGEFLGRYRNLVVDARKTLTSAAQAARSVRGDLRARPAESIEAATRLIGGLGDRLPPPSDCMLYSIGDRALGGSMYCHEVNVAILAMMLARKLGEDDDAVRQLGVGCLYHDIGMESVPPLVRNRGDALSTAERAILEEHCELGARDMREAGLGQDALAVVLRHHELADGSGYPGHLSGMEIPKLARIASVVELYDQFCNPANLNQSMTPHEAVSSLFIHFRTRIDPEVLQAFIHMMGVYPPGSIVVLSNECYGKVLAVHPDRPLQPMLLVFDPDQPGEEAALLDLETEPDVGIVRAVRPGLLSREAFAYLAPHDRATYYFGEALRQP